MSVAGPTIPCPKCKKVFKAESWHRDGMPVCQRCSTVYEFIDFPALYRDTSATTAKSAGAMAEDATCYFHPVNRAEQVCESCGRYLCPVCSIDFGGKRLCPSCISGKQTKAPEGEQGRILWDGMALSLALLPVLIWPITVVTAPAALGVAIVGWRKPSSLVRGNRTRLVIAMIVASIEIALWLFLFGSLIFSSSWAK